MTEEIKPKFSKDENVMTLPDGSVYDAVNDEGCVNCDFKTSKLCGTVTAPRCCDVNGRRKDELIIWKLRKP